MRYSRVFYPLAALLLVAVLLPACAALAGNINTNAQQRPLFRPPAPQVTATSGTNSATGQQIDPLPAGQPAADCLDNLTFLSDITIPEGTPVTAGASLEKHWEVKNSGSCGWNEHYRLRLIAGPAMGAQAEQALYPARGDSNAVLRVTFQAPDIPGSYRSAWQAHSANGSPFGDPLFIEIEVAAAAPEN